VRFHLSIMLCPTVSTKGLKKYSATVRRPVRISATTTERVAVVSMSTSHSSRDAQSSVVLRYWVAVAVSVALGATVAGAQSILQFDHGGQNLQGRRGACGSRREAGAGPRFR
jgi:hypothetical protein